eukprot:CAMPEP_0170510772 /NCGR_PEP_ID=MMETSP0208-20121228/65946_1 /TAXON_ID=197538 /ORGANISM="Strombidium inclinatum, Strain S3" /LENGTH=96 /DNA_ID=CAMNT_0010794259 /DNA_START=1620 /DNA_END=1910 /DNA_ORIENTATION=-
MADLPQLPALLLEDTDKLVNVLSDHLVLVVELTEKAKQVFDADETVVVVVQQIETEAELVLPAPVQHAVDNLVEVSISNTASVAQRGREDVSHYFL